MTLAMRNSGHESAALVPVDSGDQQIARLVGWAQAADAAYQVAERLVNTKFVPKQYQGKAYEATAAILAGAEVGLSPMASLRAFDDIQGTPAPKAITLRAIVQAHGHEFRIDESSKGKAVVSARRKGDGNWQTSTWTIDRAREMGLLGKDQWQKQPQAMLVARATSEVCRWIASDAIMGMPYTAEELSDGDSDDRPQARRLTVDELLAPESAADIEQDDQAELRINPAQVDRMFGLLAEKGFTEAYAQKVFVEARIGREVRGRDDLSAAEADVVIRALMELPAPPADETGGADLDDAVVSE